jgi:hypothetical protein
MAPDTIFVLVIVLGVVGLLIWLELANRRQDTSGESSSAEQMSGGPEVGPGGDGKDVAP